MPAFHLPNVDDRTGSQHRQHWNDWNPVPGRNENQNDGSRIEDQEQDDRTTEFPPPDRKAHHCERKQNTKGKSKPMKFPGENAENPGPTSMEVNIEVPWDLARIPELNPLGRHPADEMHRLLGDIRPRPWPGRRPVPPRAHPGRVALAPPTDDSNPPPAELSGCCRGRGYCRDESSALRKPATH